MKKLIITLTTVLASMIAMAQSQFYVIMKDGSGASYPEEIIDSLTFDKNNGAKIYGFEDLIKRISALESKVDALQKQSSNNDKEKDTTSNIANGHKYVDLDLPSGTLWATCNIGADSEEGYGFYLAWGETETKGTYPDTDGEFYNINHYTLREQGIIDKYFNLTEKYDAATVYWGEEWRMPTSEEFIELLRNCHSEWTSINGVNGIKFTSLKETNKDYIFLPCAGYKRNENTLKAGERGYYFSATSEEDNINAVDFYLTQTTTTRGSRSRSRGCTIRPVRTKDSRKPFVDERFNTSNNHTYIDLGLPSGTLWSKTNLGSDSIHTVGDIYQWGMVKPGAVDEEKTYVNVKISTLQTKAVIDQNKNLTPNHDAATYRWGAMWRMPTEEECNELKKYCKAEKKSILGVEGWELTGPSNAKLFFPNTTSYVYDGSFTWSSTADDVYDAAIILDFYDNFSDLPNTPLNIMGRDIVLPIRPVFNK